MNLKIGALVVACFFWLPLFGFGQVSQARSGSLMPIPPSVLGSQLIVWSQAQKPRPVPQPPLPPPDWAESCAQQPPEQREETQQAPSTQPFSGTIVNGKTGYLLQQSGGTTYRLDDQTMARQYAGRKVKVMGNLDPDHVLRVASIELAR